jgi:hypothetical protein
MEFHRNDCPVRNHILYPKGQSNLSFWPEESQRSVPKNKGLAPPPLLLLLRVTHIKHPPRQIFGDKLRL